MSMDAVTSASRSPMRPVDFFTDTNRWQDYAHQYHQPESADQSLTFHWSHPNCCTHAITVPRF